MQPVTKRFDCPRRNKPERGYALLVVMILATLLIISLTAALPSLYVAGMREREEELIFRGNEYARAIFLFHRQFNRYPSRVEELLETNKIHFLRRAYADPMTRKGKWRFINANATGVLLNSRTQPRPQPISPLGQTSQTPSSSSSTPSGETPSAESERSSELSEGGEGPRESSSFFTNETQGAFIVGVASRSRRKSIRVLNGRTRYDEWEFMGVPNLFAGGMGIPGGQAGSRGQGTGASGAQPPAGTQPGATSPPATPPTPPPETGGELEEDVLAPPPEPEEEEE